jgi:oligoribonuclease
VRQDRPQKVGQHRALDDIRDSIEELRYYRERVFVPPPNVEETAVHGGANGAAATTPSQEARS